ncbi:N-acetylglucosaminyltransferase [Ureibacillus manganicus DSM 26584]|uniref:N-acetylglucosaminyltransferase n=1 Tax=Ureibacillus manganicus DSM 26584 TaxID=1384049 RepID=A0A0A3I903_9BACL|nr:N-acetylglucosaminyltransferase [Ureibacillus manganicus DSM 26584]
MTTFIENFNFFMFLLFAFMYLYQMIYMIIAFKAKRALKRGKDNIKLNKIGVIIAARNEEVVIGQLINSIHAQGYPKEFIDIFVVADNCTDQTALVAKEAGAIVKERFNTDQVGKGYALDFMLKFIDKEYSYKNYDGYLVLDADNLLDKNYIAEMNKTFNEGYRVITSYRNSKNYDQNWISAGYGLWFLHEAEYFNLPRMTLNNSCAISGTGFLVKSDIFKENGGWVHHLLTEDIEFSVSQILKGEKIGYCRNAVLYDEQPITFKQSWHQRLRWAKGFYQVFSNYGKRLIGGILFKRGNRFSCYDMAMTLMPAMLITCFSIAVNSSFYLAAILGFINEKEIILVTTMSIIKSFVWYYSILFVIGFITTISEWNRIHSTGWKKIMYSFTFPLFMFTYIPIAIVALFKKVEWKPIPHTVAKTIDDVLENVKN